MASDPPDPPSAGAVNDRVTLPGDPYPDCDGCQRLEYEKRELLDEVKELRQAAAGQGRFAKEITAARTGYIEDRMQLARPLLSVPTTSAKGVVCPACGRRDGTHESDCRAVERAARERLQAECDHRPEYGATQTTGEPLGPPCCGRCGLELPAHTRYRPVRVSLPPSTEKDWVINDIQIGNVACPSDEELHQSQKHPDYEYVTTTNARKDGDMPVPEGEGWKPNTCMVPGGRSWERFEYHEVNYWMRRRRVDPRVHRPRIAHTLRGGWGNATLIRGCVCGAPVMSAEAYAEHVGWPVEAVRAVLSLAGLADDLVLYRDRERMSYDDIAQEINRVLEVRR